MGPGFESLRVYEAVKLKAENSENQKFSEFFIYQAPGQTPVIQAPKRNVVTFSKRFVRFSLLLAQNEM